MSRMKPEADLEPIEPIESLIHTVRGEKVILDADLARIYGVPTFVLTKPSSEIASVSRPILCSSSPKRRGPL